MDYYNKITPNNNNMLTDNSKYNFTNKKPIQIQINKQMEIYAKKPRTSNLANRPVDQQELNLAHIALRSLKMKVNNQNSRQKTHNNNTGIMPNNNPVIDMMMAPPYQEKNRIGTNYQGSRPAQYQPKINANNNMRNNNNYSNSGYNKKNLANLDQQAGYDDGGYGGKQIDSYAFMNKPQSNNRKIGIGSGLGSGLGMEAMNKMNSDPFNLNNNMNNQGLDNMMGTGVYRGRDRGSQLGRDQRGLNTYNNFNMDGYGGIYNQNLNKMNMGMNMPNQYGTSTMKQGYGMNNQMGGGMNTAIGGYGNVGARPNRGMNVGYNMNQGMKDPNDNDERPLDKGENVDKEKERLNPEKGEQTYPCQYCGRKFVMTTLEKHEKHCDKNEAVHKRKKYDSKKSRVTDAQIEFIKEGGGSSNTMKANKKSKAETMNKNNAKIEAKAKWKKQSEEFRNAIKCGKNPAPFGQLDPNQYKPSSITDDYVLCKFCNRKYNDEVYEKHLPGCERRFKDAQLKNKWGKKTSKK